MPLIRKNTSEPPPGADPDAPVAQAQGSIDQRWMAARSLEDVAALGRALSAESDARVREAIFNSLTRVGGPDAVAVILPYLRADDAGLRTGALDALKAMPRAVAPLLAELLDDPESDVRLLACEVVRELPGALATPLLCALLDGEEEVNVCGAAIEVLAEIGDPEALSALALCAARFAHEPFLLFAISTASSRLGAASPPQPPPSGEDDSIA